MEVRQYTLYLLADFEEEIKRGNIQLDKGVGLWGNNKYESNFSFQEKKPMQQLTYIGTQNNDYS